MKIACIGEIMVEMAHMDTDAYKMQFAGDTFNVAYYMQHLKPKDWDISYITKVGTDTISQELVSFISHMGIHTHGIQSSTDKTIGLFMLRMDDVGEKVYAYWRGQSAARTVFDTPMDLRDYDGISISGITAAIQYNRDGLIATLKQCYTMGKKIIYDFNHRKPLWSPSEARDFANQIMPYCHIIKMSDEEQEFLDMPDIASLSQSVPNAIWVYTQGEQGAQAWQNGDCVAAVPSVPPVQVVDTSAAGDSFHAGFCIHYLNGGRVGDALQVGAELASRVIAYKGSIMPMDTI